MVVVVSQQTRHDGSVAVTLSQDGTRFTVVVPQRVAESEEALNVYQVMANSMCKTAAKLADITKAGQGF